MIRQKLQEARNDISEITKQIAKLPLQKPVLRLKEKTETPAKSAKRDTSTFRVIDEKAEAKEASESAMAASFGSVMDQLKSGKNHSFDNVEETPVVPVRKPQSMNVMRPRRNEKREVGAVVEEEEGNDEKRREKVEYHEHKEFSVVVNDQVLEDIEKELGEYQPTFIKQMFKDLKGK